MCSLDGVARPALLSAEWARSSPVGACVSEVIVLDTVIPAA